MMTTENVIFMLAIPLGLAGIIGLILLSGTLSATVRRRLELSMMAVFYPGMAIFFAVRAVQTATEAQWLLAALSGALALGMAVQGAVLFRRRVRADGTRS